MVLRLQWITQEHPSGNFSDQAWQAWLQILLPDCHAFYHLLVWRIWYRLDFRRSLVSEEHGLLSRRAAGDRA